MYDSSHIIKRILLLLIFLPACALAVTKHAPAESIYSPPWIVQSTSFAMVTFSLPAADVKKYLPAGISPLVKDKGLVPTTLEVYSTERIAGLPTYKIAFIVVDIADHPSRTGTPGHFAIWGRVDSKSSLDFFTREFGFPYKLASQLDIQAGANTYKASIAGELRLHIEPLRDKPLDGNGVVDMLSIRPGTGLVKTEVPFLTQGYFGNMVSLHIEAKGDPVLDLLKNAKPDWSLIAEQQIFSYSQLAVVGR